MVTLKGLGFGVPSLSNSLMRALCGQHMQYPTAGYTATGHEGGSSLAVRNTHMGILEEQVPLQTRAFSKDSWRL